VILSVTDEHRVDAREIPRSAWKAAPLGMTPWQTTPRY